MRCVPILWNGLRTGGAVIEKCVRHAWLGSDSFARTAVAASARPKTTSFLSPRSVRVFPLSIAVNTNK